MPKFLTPEWFSKVEQLGIASKDLEIPKAMKDVVVNLTVETPARQRISRSDCWSATRRRPTQRPSSRPDRPNCCHSCTRTAARTSCSSGGWER